MSKGTQRRLAAILAADVAGYSRLMGEDETGTLKALRQFRAELFEPTIAQHHGEIAKNMGDGWLIAFDSAADAVSCAIDVQRKLIGHDVLKVRIGLHIGDVTHVDGDVFGDGINIAARLQEIAEPGAIVISETAKRSIDGKLAANFVPLGQQHLKNIVDPIFAFGWGMTEVAKEPASIALTDKPSIAVLPFHNMSADSEQEFFADGVTEDIITQLARFGSFYVTARNSSFIYRGKSVDLVQIGKNLNAQFLVEGSVRKSGNQVRISAQLIEAETGNHVWAEKFGGSLEDIFDLQDEVALRVASSVGTAINSFELAHIRRQRPESLTVWQLVLRALSLVSESCYASVKEAESLLQEAIEQEPTYAKAHAILAVCRWYAAFCGWTENSRQAFELAMVGAQKAYVLDQNEPYAYIVQSWCLNLAGRADKAVEVARRAVQIAPGLAEAHRILGGSLAFAGDGDAALESLELAARLSPQDPLGFVGLICQANAHFVNQDYDRAVKIAELGVDMQPNWPGGYWTLAASAALSGNSEAAASAIKKGLAIVPRVRVSTIAHHVMFANPEHAAAFLNGLRSGGMPE